jgi:hypothetical protein
MMKYYLNKIQKILSIIKLKYYNILINITEINLHN